MDLHNQNSDKTADFPTSQRICMMLCAMSAATHWTHWNNLSACQQPPLACKNLRGGPLRGLIWTGINCISTGVPVDTNVKYCEIKDFPHFLSILSAPVDKTEPSVRRVHCFAACLLGSLYLTSRRSQLPSRKDSVFLSSPTGEFFTAVWLLDGELQLRGLRR